MSVLLLVIGVILFVGLVVIHELGHFLIARRNGVEVEEFGIGFPPRAKILAKKEGTIYSLNWLPIGGFVKLKGEHDESTEPGSFGAAKIGAKVRIILAGVIMNFLAAAFLLTLVALMGMPKADLKSLPFYDRNQFSLPSDTIIINSQVLVGVIENSPAAKAGLKSGDQIITIAETPITKAEKLPSVTESYKGQTVNITYRRDNGPEQIARATLNEERSEETGHLGVVPVNSETFRATWSAPIVGLITAAQYTDVSFRGLGYVVQNLFAGETEVAQEAVGGPVAIFKTLSDVSSSGLPSVLFLIALVSISLAVMNSLPIPALDGGRLFVTLLFRALNKPLTKPAEDLIHGIGFLFLMGLIILITIIDIRRFF